MTDYSKLTYNSPHWIKRFSHKKRFEYVYEFLLKNQHQQPQKILDYGSGDGFFFKNIDPKVFPKFSFDAYEPICHQYAQLIENEKDSLLKFRCLKELDVNLRYDFVLCLEVLEHFTASEILNHINRFKDILEDDGTLVISVPIEIGLSGLIKNIVRMGLDQQHQGLTLRKAILSLINYPIYRGASGYLSSHVGFSHKNLRYLLIDSGFEVQKQFFSPMKMVGPICNSQVFYICRKKR